MTTAAAIATPVHRSHVLPTVSSAGPTCTKVADLAVVKTELGLGDTSQDAKLNRIIAGVTASVVGGGGLRREPWRATYTMTLAGHGGLWLSLPRWPVESVTSVTFDGETVDSTTYSVASEDRDRLYAESLWNDSYGDLDYVVVAVAGWVMPPDVEDWTAATTYGAVGQKHFVRASDPSVTLLFEATTAGTSHASAEPTWPTAAGDTVVDNDITWTARSAYEFPEDLREACLIAVMDWYRGGLQVPSNVQSERIGPWAATYRPGAETTGIHPVVARVCEGYR